VEQQSVMELLIQKGYSVYLLTLTREGALHEYARSLGVKAFALPADANYNFKNVFKNTKQLIRFCKLYNIKIILAHQQLAAVPLIFAQPFLKLKSYYFRHNTDEDYKVNPLKARLLNTFINAFTQNIIAPSDAVYEYMIQKEKLAPQKIRRINYGYNFLQYEKSESGVANEIRRIYSCKLLVLSIARLVPPKRHIEMFECIKSLAMQGSDVKLICLGEGQLKIELEKWIVDNKMQQHIFLQGRKTNVFDYLSACDVLLHLSESEASNSVVKEAGITGKPVIVCKSVGDFSDYIRHGENGFLVSKEYPISDTIAVLNQCYADTSLLTKTGEYLYHTVTDLFDIKNVEDKYQELINTKS
jgi:glycosyltransferase involved in cell wall biosynthesis